MAIKVASSTGNFSSASTWDSVTNVPTIHATTNLANVIAGRFTATFTAPNTTNACTGCLVYIAVLPTVSMTVTLQQSSVDTTATTTIPVANLVVGWNYFRFASPFTFTTVTAGTYRFKVSATSTSGTNAMDSGGTLVAFIATDNRTGVPATTDDIWIASHNNTGSVPVVTVDGTQAIGSGTNVAAVSITMTRAVDLAVNVSGGGTGGLLQMDTAASSQLTITGHAYAMNGGAIIAGTTSSPYPAGLTCKIIINNSVDGRWGLSQQANGIISMVGATLTNWKGGYVSGLGTAASPLITDADIGVVGDRVLISGTTVGASQTEVRYIITKNSSTSYVVSSTSGGAETALVATHAAGAHIVNTQRNVVYTATSATFGTFINNYSNAAGLTLKWMSFENPHNGNGILVSASANNTATAVIDYIVVFMPKATGISFAVSKATSTHTGIIIYGVTGTNPGLNVGTNANNKTFNDLYLLAFRRSAMTIAAFNITFNRLICANNNMDSTAAAAGVTLGVGQMNINSSRFYANGVGAVLAQGITDSSINNSFIGVLGTNANLAITLLADTYNTIVVSNTTIGDSTLLAGYANLIPGSNVAFENLNGTTYNNIAYTENGKLNATGAGLTDTTVRSGTTGEHSVRLDSETTTGRSTTFDVVATPNEAVLVTGYIWENAAFVADGAASVIAELYLPGLIVGTDTPSATVTMTKTTSSSSVNAAFTLAAFYSGLTYDVATVRIKAITTTAGAYAYIGSINQGGNPATKYNIWRDGRPIDFMPEAIGDAQTIAAAVWNYLTVSAATTGTFGKVVGDTNLTNLLAKDKLS